MLSCAPPRSDHWSNMIRYFHGSPCPLYIFFPNCYRFPLILFFKHKPPLLPLCFFPLTLDIVLLESSAPEAPILPAPRRLCEQRPCCVRHFHSWKAWRVQVVNDPVTIHAAHPLTAQVLRELEECLSPSVPAFLAVFPRFMTVSSAILTRVLSFFLHPCLRAKRGPWIWALSFVSNLLMLCLCHSSEWKLCDVEVPLLFLLVFRICVH